MIVRRLAVLGLLILCLSSQARSTRAQGFSFDQRVSQLEAAVEELRTTQQRHHAAVGNLAEKLDTLEKQLTARHADTAGDNAALNEVKAQLQRLTQAMEDQADQIRSLASAQHEVRLKVANPPPVLRTTGRVMVVNKMQAAQSLVVNGTSYRVGANSQISVVVPVGTVSSELVGFEGPKTFTIGAPRYEQTIEITPGPNRNVVNMPVFSNNLWTPW